MKTMDLDRFGPAWKVLSTVARECASQVQFSHDHGLEMLQTPGDEVLEGALKVAQENGVNQDDVRGVYEMSVERLLEHLAMMELDRRLPEPR